MHRALLLLACLLASAATAFAQGTDVTIETAPFITDYERQLFSAYYAEQALRRFSQDARRTSINRRNDNMGSLGWDQRRSRVAPEALDLLVPAAPLPPGLRYTYPPHALQHELPLRLPPQALVLVGDVVLLLDRRSNTVLDVLRPVSGP